MATVSALLLYTAHRTHVCRPDAWARYTEAISLEPGNHLAHTTHDGEGEKPKEVSWFTPEHYVTTVHAQQELKINGRFADRWIVRGPSAYPDGGFRLAVQIDNEANDVDHLHASNA